jgi:hypothetical protein
LGRQGPGRLALPEGGCRPPERITGREHDVNQEYLKDAYSAADWSKDYDASELDATRLRDAAVTLARVLFRPKRTW